MKKMIILLLINSVYFISCNNKFLDRYPLDEISGDTYWNTEQDLELYNNAIYPLYITGLGTGFDDSTVQPRGIYEAQLAYGDEVSDNAAPNTYSLVAANQYIRYLSDGSGSDGWNFENIRKLNFFLDNYENAQIPEATKHIYAGEIYFFKAWDYFEKVKLFGDVPWLSHALTTDSSQALIGARTPRAQVMDSVMKILDTAIAWLPEKGSEASGRLNKDVALHLKARIGLHEGTFRKYHNLEGAEQYLQIAADASDQLMSGNHYALYKYPASATYPTVDVDKIVKDFSYFNIFAQYDYSDNSEIILWKQYSADLQLGTTFSRYFAQNLRGQFGVTRNMVDEYLCTDGKPISTSTLFNISDRGDITKEFANRDPRLSQTVAQFGTFENSSSNISGTNTPPYPNLPGLSGNKCPTGYRLAKWFLNDPADWARIDNGMQAAPMFRYAETLLINAEAKCELGECTQIVLDQTINLLRRRVGMPDLELASVPSDPELDLAYKTYCDYVPSALLREIRRERRVELAFENFRWDDLMRWKAGKFLDIPVLGYKYKPEQLTTLTSPPVIGKDVYVNQDGFIEPYQKTLSGNRVFDDRQYYFPIPIQDLVLNPNLTQNPGWQSN